MDVLSPGPEGFVVIVMSNFTEVSVNIDGNGKIIPCISHNRDHIIKFHTIHKKKYEFVDTFNSDILL